MKKLLLLFILTGCTEIIAAKEIEPPPEWEVYYEHVQECSRKQGPDFSTIKWFEAQRIHGTIVGLAWNGDIYLESEWQIEQIIKHELLHVIGFRHPTRDRPYPWPFTPCEWWRPN